jgi:hypothetical protein
MKWTLLFVSLSAFAAKDASFTMLLNRGSDKSWYSVSQVRGKTICATSQVPYFEADSNPVKNVDWVQLEKEAKEKFNCTNKVAFSFKNKKAVICAELPYTAKLVLKITAACSTLI